MNLSVRNRKDLGNSTQNLSSLRFLGVYSLIIVVAMVLIAILTIILLLRPPSSERCVAIFQNIASLFFALWVFDIAFRSRTAPPLQLEYSWQALVVPLVAGAAVWTGSISTYFISDDFGHLNAMSSPLKSIVWENLIRGQAHTFIRPLGFLSLAIDYRLFHFWAPGFHIVCVLFHLTAVAGLFFLCRQLGLSTEVCTMTALFYAVLPINAEAIVWIACRFDQVATPLMLWSLFAYLRFRNGSRRGFLVLALCLFLLALFSKESAYALPLIVLLLELVILRPRRLFPATAFLGLAAACFLYRWWALGGIGGYREASGANSALQISSNTFKGLLLRAPAEMLFGVNWVQPSIRATLLIASVAAFILFALLVFPIAVKRSYLYLAIGWMLLAPLPAHSMVRIGAELVNSRELYFASAGAALLIALLVGNIPQSGLRIRACALLVLVFAGGAWHNLTAWRYAAAMSRRIPKEVTALYPNPPAATEFVISNLPRSIHGIYFYQTGLNEAIKLAYARRDISARRSTELENSGHRAKTFVNLCWVSAERDGGRLVPCSGATMPIWSP